MTPFCNPSSPVIHPRPLLKALPPTLPENPASVTYDNFQRNVNAYFKKMKNGPKCILSLIFKSSIGYIMILTPHMEYNLGLVH